MTKTVSTDFDAFAEKVSRCTNDTPVENLKELIKEGEKLKTRPGLRYNVQTKQKAMETLNSLMATKSQEVSGKKQLVITVLGIVATVILGVWALI